MHFLDDLVELRHPAQHDHEIALARLRSAGAQITVVESVIYEALERAGTPGFRTVLELVKAHPING